MFYKKGRYYMVKFRWQGKLIRKSTRATNIKTARNIEGKIRSELAQGNFGILAPPKPKPTLVEFFRNDFLPFTESMFKESPKTLEYYNYGAKLILGSELSKLKIDEITDQHTGQFSSRNSHLTPSTVNCGLRTLRRAINLAVEWGQLEKKPKLSLAKGEQLRERVLSDAEVTSYLDKSPQPWKDAATIILGTGFRPGEVFVLRWESILMQEGRGLIGIVKGKSKAAKRALPMMPKVYDAIRERFESQGRPTEGWVFPSGSKPGHFNQGTAKKQHAKALKDSAVRPFEPYTLRHTALTNLGDSGCDVFTLAKIAGHSSIIITQRYVHPQADAIERAFAKMASGRELVTEGGHQQIELKKGVNAWAINIEDK